MRQCRGDPGGQLGEFGCVPLRVCEMPCASSSQSCMMALMPFTSTRGRCASLVPYTRYPIRAPSFVPNTWGSAIKDVEKWRPTTMDASEYVPWLT